MAKGNGTTKSVGSGSAAASRTSATASSGGGNSISTNYAQMDIKEAKKELLGRKLTVENYWSDGKGNSVEATGEITQVRLYGKNKLPIAEVSFTNGEKLELRLSDIDKKELTNGYLNKIRLGKKS